MATAWARMDETARRNAVSELSRQGVQAVYPVNWSSPEPPVFINASGTARVYPFPESVPPVPGYRPTPPARYTGGGSGEVLASYTGGTSGPLSVTVDQGHVVYPATSWALWALVALGAVLVASRG